ncbi:S100P-binding protein [Oncorhynchus kisutch]|uniref:S100P-binding protein n=1 Tax=Oncorhynchus kisutch TaxID=8019 RepID=A0A8C7G674_ONCKI|nr:S100P-binding protein [Oncorhynchus kisutch]XP_031644107.1 S100P-binding protein [Oncorhynchus kisutch]XP_031644108.1 S100P-binding protein [Oncorhynchus kisutch]XP_031644110.1 S100P-binding protein [Oncorhynchus kisutch]
MERPIQPLKTIFHRRSSAKPRGDDKSFGHLRPLSVYSRMITCENGRVSPSGTNQSWNSSNPFCNLKVEIVNNNAPTRHKRRLDDSCLDDTYETTYKKPCSPKAISPDLACVVVSCSILPGVATVSPTTDLQKVPSSVENTVKDKGTSEAVICVPNSDHIQCGQAGEAGSRPGGAAAPGGPVSNESEAWSETLSHEPEKVSMDLGPVFDFDVDDIMCLSPIDSDRGSDEGIEAFVDSCNSFYDDCTRNPSDGDTQPTKPFLAHSSTQNHVSREGYDVGEREEGKGKKMVGERGKEGNGEINHQEEEEVVSIEGVFSRSYLAALKAGKDVSQAVPPLQPRISSSPLFMGREVMQRLQMAVSDDGEPPCPPGFSDPNGGQAMVCQPHYSFTSEDVAYGLYGAPLVPVEGADEGLEGTAGDDWSIGAPILESSLCHVAPVEFNAGCEGNVVEGGGGVLDSVQECQVTLLAEEVTVEPSYENAFPLQVQVRSVLVVPSVQQSSSSQPSTLPEHVQKPSLEKNVVKTTTRPVQKPSPGQNIIKNTIVHKPSLGQKVTKIKPVQAASTSSDQKVVNTRPVQKPSPGQNIIKNTIVHKPSLGQKVTKIKTVQAASTSSDQKVVNTRPVQKPSPGQNIIKNTIVHKPSLGQKVTKIKPVQAASTSSDQKVVNTRPVQKTAPRPVVYDREEDWQREKWLYVDSVTRHIRENIGAGEGVMTELLNLMNHVADQRPGTNGRQWQHPSDLTRRNYQRRFGNDRTNYTLDEWQNQNYRNHQRFANLPQIFERSPVL